MKMIARSATLDKRKRPIPNGINDICCPCYLVIMLMQLRGLVVISFEK